VLHFTDCFEDWSVPFVRAIGRWTMTALVINCGIGSGIFGLPSELTRLLGRASPIAMIVAGLAMVLIMLCVAEVASQFDEPGGAYLYARTAFGRFAGMQVGWFSLLAPIGGGAANASLFMIYLGGFLPWAGRGWQRMLLLAVLILIPTVANYVGVRSGATLSNLLTVAKLSPLALLITLGGIRFGQHFQVIHTTEITSPGLGAWLSALLLLLFAYGGPENALIPTGEVKEPRRTVPFGLLAGLLVCVFVYTLVQFVTVATIGTSVSRRPLADTASVLIGGGGGIFVAIAVMISTYGWVSGGILNVPRLACSLASQGDFPGFFGKLHPRFNTPATAIVLYTALVLLFAATGTYLWLVALTGGSIIVIYIGTCAALLRLRRQNPHVDALRIPFGRWFAIAGIIIAIAVLTRLQSRELLLMGVTALIATANWGWAKRRENTSEAEVRLP
jgi:basic amino acid/polyamine antiporter, APA family